MIWPFKKKSCLEWKGLRDKDGYGRVKVSNTDTKAHRAMYELWYGVKLQREDVLLHACDNPKCFNPHHLTKGTQAENIKDMDQKGRRVSASSGITHCPRGHPYDEENTIIYRDGKRRCRACMVMNRRKR